MKFAVITFPHCLDTDTGTAAGPKALLQAGLTDWLRAQGHAVAGPFHVQLIPEEEAAYGAWNQIGLANVHLARLVSDAVTAQAFPLLLESNCYAAIGALAGLQKSVGSSAPRLGILDRRARRLQHPGHHVERYAERDACRHCHRALFGAASQTGGTRSPACPARCRDGWRAGE